MSALPPKPDIDRCHRDVRFGPKADIGCFAAVATMDVAAGAVAIGACLRRCLEGIRSNDGLLYDLQVLRVLLEALPALFAKQKNRWFS
jgi:hypothetical protein